MEDKTCISSSVRFTQTSYSTSNIVTIGLPASSLSNGQYCFNVTGDNGTFSTVLEGIFNNDKMIIIVTQGNFHKN